MKTIFRLITVFYTLLFTNQIYCQDSYDFKPLIDYIKDSKIIAQDDENTYLGTLSNSFNSESIFNEFGTYGSEFSAKSIWNQFSKFGNEFNQYSPFNSFSARPPMLIKKVRLLNF